ncbi:DUF6878 family protein [Sphingobium sp. Cam5-1]|uniref:DUF6878 family protein n=1 Tax=Sphingobium sp. Cam5-1 TaxID=2789327 RepID=UPI0018AD0EBD|nr:DUF6878 family protein [Sphingobium sp. Cam5-1]QPI75520.1 hypothetical protein IZV00_18880 [Sphingobium sp. Cam5-1]
MTDIQLTPEHAAAAARIVADIDEQLARVREAESRCKAAFLPLLAEHGITRVEIGYDGGGDEGSVGDVTAYAGDAVQDLPTILCDHFAVEWGGGITSRAIQLGDALSAFAENAASDHHSGWENGEGAWGTIEIDVASGAVTLTHNSRFIDYETSETEL